MDYGEIVQLGRHRLMCGDTTSREDVMHLVGNDRVNLVLTDPPWGMKVQHTCGSVGCEKPHKLMIHGRTGEYPAHIYSMMGGDNSPDTARKHYEIARTLTDRLIIWGAQYFAHFLPVSGGWIFWDKMRGNDDFSDGELAWCNVGKKLRKYSHKWNGMIMQGSKKLNPCPRVHPTQKPVELFARILEDFTQPGDVVLDCFGGSGTTLIACEITGRKCLMMEISPEYCGIIQRRYEELAEGEIPLEVANA